MNDFLLVSIVASVVLTLLLNVLPLIFPDAAAKLQRKIEQNARRAIAQHKDDAEPRVKVLFPWRTMLLVSVVLTVLVNLVSLVSR